MNKKFSKILFFAFLLTLINIVSCNKKEFKKIDNVSIANPFIEYDDIDEAADDVGFMINCPSGIYDYDKPIYRVAKSINLFEVQFKNVSNLLMYRKQFRADKDDISGDYKDYSVEYIEDIDGVSVKMKGTDDGLCIATFKMGDYTYSYTSLHPDDEDNFKLSVKSFIEDEK